MFKLSEKQMRLYRRNIVGFVWQNSARNLLSNLTALENVQMITRLKNSEEKAGDCIKSSFKSRNERQDGKQCK